MQSKQFLLTEAGGTEVTIRLWVRYSNELAAQRLANKPFTVFLARGGLGLRLTNQFTQRIMRPCSRRDDGVRSLDCNFPLVHSCHQGNVVLVLEARGSFGKRREQSPRHNWSEQQTRGNLHLPVAVAVQCAGDDSKVGGTDIPTCISTWIREMRRVCQIVSFASHFQLEALAHRKGAE